MTLHTWMLRLNVFITCLWTVIVSIWHKNTLCACFPFFDFFLNYLCSIWILVKPNFDQDLNKFETWKCKTKPGSFLAAPKWSIGEVFENFMFKIQNHFSSTLTLYDRVWDITLDTWILSSNVFVTCLWTVIVSIWHNKIMCAGFSFFQYFLNFLLIFMFGQTQLWLKFKQGENMKLKIRA